MSWSPRFRAALGESILVPRFLWQTIRHTEGPGRSLTLGMLEGDRGGALLTADIRTAGQSVQPVTWQSTAGAWSVSVATGQGLGNIAAHLVRGQMCRLLMGFEGWTLSDYEPIAIGMVRNIRGVGPTYTIDCWDLFSAMQTRITTITNELALFYDVGASTTLASNYTAGDATVQAITVSGFERETGGKFGFKITPTTGTPFYLTATGTSVNDFTGCSAAGVGGTSAVDAVAGDLVEEVVYLVGHPFDIARKLITSTGSGTNGAFDTLPKSWGWGIDSDLIDSQDFLRWKTQVVTVASGSYDWEVIEPTPIDAPLSWLQSLLGDAGMWLTARQGQISVRAAQDPESAATVVSGLDITDDDIMGVDGWMAWDPQTPVEYASLKVRSDSGTTTSTSIAVGTLPGIQTYEVDLSDRVTLNQAEIRTETRDRLEPWATRIPERLQVTCGGLRLARAVPGDILEITTEAVSGRLETTRHGYSSRRCMVMQADPQYTRSHVRLTLSVLPSYTGETP